ncbi:hypothetical protein, partial [Xenorhabdus bovienii]|uniref:hypothetical protein n=1 Tax=Xenorhabdus bovienii TaxID=40576 RepID=UPI0023B2C676
DDGINTGHNNVIIVAGQIIGLQSNYGCSTNNSSVMRTIAIRVIRKHISFNKDGNTIYFYQYFTIR